MGVLEHLVVIMKYIYNLKKATVRAEYEETDSFQIGKRQGYILSPDAFNLYVGHIIRETGMEENNYAKGE